MSIIRTLKKTFIYIFFYKKELRESVRSELGLTPETFTLLFVGRIERFKNIELFIKFLSLFFVRASIARLCTVISESRSYLHIIFEGTGTVMLPSPSIATCRTFFEGSSSFCNSMFLDRSVSSLPKILLI